MAQQKTTVPVKVTVPNVIAASEVAPVNEMQKNEKTGRWKVIGQRENAEGVPLWQVEVMLPGKQFGNSVLEKVRVSFASEQAPEIQPGEMITVIEPQGRIATLTADRIEKADQSNLNTLMED